MRKIIQGTVQETSEGMRTRPPPKAPALICGMLHNGGCTKVFKTRQELASTFLTSMGNTERATLKL